MKRSKRFLVLAFCVLTLFMLEGVAAGYSENEITVKGSVYGSAWDDKGAATAVSILTIEGDELFVVHTPVGDELLKLVEQNVKVTGAVLLDKAGKKNFTVYKYEVLFN
ncbi:MAG: hypothetical protein NTX75_07115 [Proteobacteria bacterium]|nr:hypothetical protein [Pseudomonadota bacterium]